MKPPSRRPIAFWTILVAFLTWDHARSPRIDLRFEPPLIAAGSGQVATAGHSRYPDSPAGAEAAADRRLAARRPSTNVTELTFFKVSRDPVAYKALSFRLDGRISTKEQQ
jgi:hypothetical protein